MLAAIVMGRWGSVCHRKDCSLNGRLARLLPLVLLLLMCEARREAGPGVGSCLLLRWMFWSRELRRDRRFGFLGGLGCSALCVLDGCAPLTVEQP